MHIMEIKLDCLLLLNLVSFIRPRHVLIVLYYSHTQAELQQKKKTLYIYYLYKNYLE